MKKNVMKLICGAAFAFIGVAASAQTATQTTAPSEQDIQNKNIEAQQTVSPEVLEQHLETVNPSVQSEPIHYTNSNVSEVDYNRLQTMSPAQREEILSQPDKYKVINQPK